MKIGVTGHRPERIQGQEKEIAEWLREQLIQYGAGSTLITGMAKGVDQIAALEAVNLGIPLHCYFPYKHKMSDVEEYLISYATEIQFISEDYYNGVYLDRDRKLVRDCDILLVVWDGKKVGGTYYTKEYAEDMRKEIIIYNWEQGKWKTKSNNIL